MKKPNIFESLLDDADHIFEVRPRPNPWPNGGTLTIKRPARYQPDSLYGTSLLDPRSVVGIDSGHSPFDPGELAWSPEEIVLLKAAAEKAGPINRVLVHTLVRPVASLVKCKHEWPETGSGTDMNGSCTVCGMSFMLYVHSECP